MTTQRRIGIVMLLSAIALGAVLPLCFVRIFRIDTTTIIEHGSSTTSFEILPNWFVVGPLSLWALAAAGLLMLPSRLGSRYWEKFQKTIPQSVRYILIVVSLVVAASAGVYVLRGNIFDPLDRGPWRVVNGEYVGQTKTAIEARYGPPSSEWQGFYGNPSYQGTRKYDPAISVTYRRGGGTLYLSFQKQQDEWTCFDSSWLPKGTVF